MNIEDIAHDLIEPNPENPNQMGDAALKALKAEISERGFMQPVLVRPHPDTEGHFQIIDGEHRWLILGELGAETVPCVVDRDADDTDATVRMVTMNRLRGQFVPIRLAHLLADLRERIPENELLGRLNLNQADLGNYLALADFLTEPPLEGGMPGPGGSPDDDRVEIVFVCTRTQARQVDALLEKRTGGDTEREPAVLSRLARDWAP